MFASAALTEFPEIVRSAVQTSSAQIDRVVERLLADEPALQSSLDFGPMVRQGKPDGPSLIIADHSGIDLFSLERVGLYEHRMALLAKPGDTVMVRRRVPAFEHYLAEYLGLENVRFIAIGSDNAAPLARTCREDPDLLARLVTVLPSATPLSIQAYLTTGQVWRLAEALGEMRQSPVFLAGPAPRVAKRANDKLWFWELARVITGRESVPPTVYAFGPAAAAAKVARFAERFPSVVVKVTSSAGGRGNLRLDSAVLLGMSVAEIRALIMDRLVSTGWKHTYPVLVGVWETGVTASPSAQIWVPLPQEGPPRILGLFEQRVAGAAGVFSGARPAEIGDAIARKMVAEAAVIGAVLQKIGYFGPCSLDAVVRDVPGDQSELHWIECNGRWSGVSIPFACAAKLLGPSAPEGMDVIQEIFPDATRLSVPDLCALLDKVMFRNGKSREGIVVLSPPDMQEGFSLNVMALAESQAHYLAMISFLRHCIETGTA